MRTFRDIHYRTAPNGKPKSADYIEVVLDPSATVDFDLDGQRLTIRAHRGDMEK